MDEVIPVVSVVRPWQATLLATIDLLIALVVFLVGSAMIFVPKTFTDITHISAGYPEFPTISSALMIAFGLIIMSLGFLAFLMAKAVWTGGRWSLNLSLAIAGFFIFLLVHANAIRGSYLFVVSVLMFYLAIMCLKNPYFSLKKTI